MSLDDQLFKQDGTLLTRVDVIVLKFSRMMANVLFAEDDDETYNRALRRMYLNAAILMAVSGVLKGIAGNYLAVAFGFLLAGIYWMQVKIAKCNGYGTNVPQFMKAASLAILSLPLTTLPLMLSAKGIIGLLGEIIHMTAFFLYILAGMYVIRLQNKPPKKKRVRVFKLAFNHTS